MKTNTAKPDNLSVNQGALWDAVTSSPHPLNTISKRSGYSEQAIKNWMKGVYEPQQVAYNNIIEAIQTLEGEPPTSINWKLKKAELIHLKTKGLSNRKIATIMNTSIVAIQRASIRHYRDAA